jgi:hypothetical protein
MEEVMPTGLRDLFFKQFYDGKARLEFREANKRSGVEELPPEKEDVVFSFLLVLMMAHSLATVGQKYGVDMKGMGIAILDRDRVASLCYATAKILENDVFYKDFLAGYEHIEKMLLPLLKAVDIKDEFLNKRMIEVKTLLDMLEGADAINKEEKILAITVLFKGILLADKNIQF